MGGRASVVSSFLGVLIMAVLEAGLSALGARDETKRVLTGGVIVVAVIVDYYRMRLFRRRRV
jgi:ribose transport system permease protein